MSINEQRMLFQGGDALPQSTLLDGGVVAVEDDDETGPPQASGPAPALAALTTAAEADVAAAAVAAAAPQASGSVVEECVRHDVANDQSTAEWGEGSDIAQMSDIASLAGEDFASLAGDLELGGAIVSGEQPAFEPTMPLTAGCAMERFSIDTVAAWHGQHNIVCCDCMQPCKASFRLISKGELEFRCGKCGVFASAPLPRRQGISRDACEHPEGRACRLFQGVARDECEGAAAKVPEDAFGVQRARAQI